MNDELRVHVNTQRIRQGRKFLKLLDRCRVMLESADVKGDPTLEQTASEMLKANADSAKLVESRIRESCRILGVDR